MDYLVNDWVLVFFKSITCIVFLFFVDIVKVRLFFFFYINDIFIRYF